MRRLLSTLLLTAAAMPAAALDTTSEASAIAFDLTFNFHVDDRSPKQDVFIRTEDAARNVLRPQPGYSHLAAPLFASAEPQAHAPFDQTAIGSFPAGQPFGLSLGDWLSAAGTGTYRCEGGQRHREVEFIGLVPDRTCTIWHFFAVNGATEPFIGSFDLPLGAYNGSQAGFAADADGKAPYDQTLATCLQLSSEQLMAGLAVNCNCDGQAYGILPSDIGQNAHIPIYAALPTRRDL